MVFRYQDHQDHERCGYFEGGIPESGCELECYPPQRSYNIVVGDSTRDESSKGTEKQRYRRRAFLMYSMESMLLPGVWHDMNASGMAFMCIKRNMVVRAKVRKLREIFPN